MIIALLLIILGVVLSYTGFGLIVGLPLILIGLIMIIYKIFKVGFKGAIEGFKVLNKKNRKEYIIFSDIK